MTAGAREDRPAADHVYSWVRNGIASGRFQAEVNYSVHQLAEQLGISRTPIREAVLRLADVGLVRIDRNRGFVVETLTVEKVRLNYEARLLIEVPAARAAALTRDAALHASLDRHLERMDGYLAEANMPGYREWDRSFHAEIIEAAGNARIRALSAHLRDASVQMWGMLTIGLENFRERSWRQHLDIANAIKAGEADRAGTAMRLHLEGAALGFMQRTAAATGETMPECFRRQLHPVAP